MNLASRETHRPGETWTGFLVFFIAFGLIIPIWLSSQASTDGLAPRPLALVLQVAVVLYSAAHVSAVFGRGQPDWMAMAFWGYVYTWLGVAPLVQLVAQVTPLKFSPTPESYVLQALVVLVGCAAYDLGFGLTRVRVAEKSNRKPRAPRVLSFRRTVFFSLFALTLTPYFVKTLGGVGALFESRDAKFQILQTAGLYTDDSKGAGALVSAVGSVLPFLALYALIYFINRGDPRARKPAIVVLLALVLGMNVLLNNPISSSRFWFLVVVIAIAFSFNWISSQSGVRLMTTAFVSASIIVFPYLDAFRYSNATLVKRSVTDFFLYKTDYDSLTQIGNAIGFASARGSTGGSQLLGSIFFWVPRNLWPEKAIDTGSLLAQWISYPNQNLSSPLWGEFFIDFGYVGVAVGFLIFGALSAVFSKRFSATGAALPGAAISFAQFVLPVLAIYQVLILRGSLLQAMGKLAVLVVLLWLFTEKAVPAVHKAQGKQNFEPKKMVGR